VAEDGTHPHDSAGQKPSICVAEECEE